MQAAVLEKVGRLFIKDVSDPLCLPDGLVIKVEACAICGTDLHIYDQGHDLISYPRIPGHEVSGTVVEVGKEIEGFRIGDRIAVAPALACGICNDCQMGWQNLCLQRSPIGYQYNGGFAEYMAVPGIAIRNGYVNQIPENVSSDEAAIAEPLACCINAFERSAMEAGKLVVVIGAGPIGCFQAQLARAWGACKVILIDELERRLKMAQFVKADYFLNSSKEDLVTWVIQETEGKGADLVIIACGSKQAQEMGQEMLGHRGYLNLFGALPRSEPYMLLNSNLVLYKELHVVGTFASTPRHNRLALKFISRGIINARDTITHKLPLDKILEGYKLVRERQGLKVLIKP